jgi:hypothetical protein
MRAVGEHRPRAVQERYRLAGALRVNCASRAAAAEPLSVALRSATAKSAANSSAQAASSTVRRELWPDGEPPVRLASAATRWP